MIRRWIGWLAVAAVLLTYALVSFGALDPQGAPFLVINALSAALLARVTYRKRAWQPFALYVAWTLIALVSLAF